MRISNILPGCRRCPGLINPSCLTSAAPFLQVFWSVWSVVQKGCQHGMLLWRVHPLPPSKTGAGPEPVPGW